MEEDEDEAFMSQLTQITKIYPVVVEYVQIEI